MKERYDAIWHLSARIEFADDKRNPDKKIATIVIKRGPSGNVWKTLRDKKVTVSDEDKVYIKRIIASKFIVARQSFDKKVSLKQIESILQSQRILKKTNKDTYRIDSDFIRSTFNKDIVPKKPFNKGGKPFNKRNGNGGYNNRGNSGGRPQNNRRFNNNRGNSNNRGGYNKNYNNNNNSNANE